MEDLSPLLNALTDMTATLLTLNSGSSSLKASLFCADGTRHSFHYGPIGQGGPRDSAEAFDRLLHDLGSHIPDAIGHRFVHGGDATDLIRRIDTIELARLERIAPLAPLHMHGNLLGVKLCQMRFNVPQFACFDTAFHATLPPLARRLPIPNHLGIRRYGFHGINYAHIARRLPSLLGATAQGRIIVAHLGSGSSLCLLEKCQSIDTSMGYTPAGGIPMGTRSGDLDPGVMLALAQRYDSNELTDLVYHQMGLRALSEGESSEMSVLLNSTSVGAQFAVRYFSHQVRAAIGAIAAKAGGVDALVFTGGIGEHAPRIRAMICDPLAFIGLQLDPDANQINAQTLHAANSKPILMLVADEEDEMRLWMQEHLALDRG